MKAHTLSFALALLACAAAGCNPLKPQPDPTQYFVLSPADANGSVIAATAKSASRLSVGVGPIQFPGYLKRPGVVTRTDSNQLKVSDEKRWGEPLDENFESVLQNNLARMLGTQRISTYPWYSDTHIDYQVEVRVEHFEAMESGGSQFSAYWIIKDGRDGRQLATGQTCDRPGAKR